jgi:hypothetical protein
MWHVCILHICDFVGRKVQRLKIAVLPVTGKVERPTGAEFVN